MAQEYKAVLRTFDTPQRTKTGAIRKTAAGKPLYATYIDLSVEDRKAMISHMKKVIAEIREQYKARPVLSMLERSISPSAKTIIENDPVGYTFDQRLKKINGRLRQSNKKDIPAGHVAWFNHVVELWYRSNDNKVQIIVTGKKTMTTAY